MQKQKLLLHSLKKSQSLVALFHTIIRLLHLAPRLRQKLHSYNNISNLSHIQNY